MRLAYRARQLGHILTAAPHIADLQAATALLTPAQLALFQAMHPAEQAHSLRVHALLVQRGQTNPDLLMAALLHDTGKTHHLLGVGERVWIVLVHTICPNLEIRWGDSALPTHGVSAWLRRSLIIARQHPAWGAALATQTGASPLCVNLIRRHQDLLPNAASTDPQPASVVSLEAQLLHELQAADNQN